MKKLFKSLFKKNTIIIDLDEVIRRCDDKEVLNRIAFIVENKIKLIEWREEMRKKDC